jgi:hypothetical protein
MSSYREDCIEAKAVKAGIVEPRPLRGKNKSRPAPFVVEYRAVQQDRGGVWMSAAFLFNWRKYGAYRTLEQAQTTMEQQARKMPFYDFRLRANQVPIKQTRSQE